MNRRLIIDGSNMLFRSYWIAENGKSNFEDKYDVGTIYIFLKSLKSVVDIFNPDETWVTWDKRLTKNSTNFRKLLAENTYKQQRDVTISTKVHEYHDRLEKWISLLGVYQMYPNVLEADDVMSWLAMKNMEGENIIVTVDKDLLQLVNSQTSYYNPIKKITITPINFESEVGVPMKDFLYYKALLGDISDNVVGIEGYGKVKSKKLAVQGLEGIKEKLEPECWERFNKNIQIMDLSDSYNKEVGEVDCYLQQYGEQTLNIKPDMKTFEEFCEKNGIYYFSRNINDWKRSFVTEQTLMSLLSTLK